MSQNQDKEIIIFLQEQNKDLKEALNTQLDKIFTLQEEKSQLEEEMDFLKCEKQANTDNDDKSIQTNEQFDDPFEKELFEDRLSQGNSFRYSLTEMADNDDAGRGSNITYLTTRNEGSMYGQEEYMKLRGATQEDVKETGAAKNKFNKKPQAQQSMADRTHIQGLENKLESLTEELLSINKENLKLKHELKTAVTSLQKLQIIHESYEDRLKAKDVQILELKDEIVKIGNMVNEEKLADYTAIIVRNVPLFQFLTLHLGTKRKTLESEYRS